jgi:hypothetical protein
MTRLHRPHVPLSIQCDVVMRQCYLTPTHRTENLRRFKGNYSVLKQTLLIAFAASIKCSHHDLQLDHDPPLGARRQIWKSGKFVRYEPDANDPQHLFWRDKESHRVKTRVRGEHGQYSDLALIKRERRRSRPKKKGQKFHSAKRAWPKRKFEKRKR